MKAKDLKNSILQMAIEGKLVPQDPSDEPASVLLERIREEKHKLIAEGKAKFPKGGESIIYIGSDGSPYEKHVDTKGRVLSDKCIADEVPFGIPESWAWARFSEVIGIAARLVDPLKYQDFPHIAPDNIQKGTGKLLFCHSVKADEVKSANHLFSAGQILYSKIRPALRKAVIAPFDGLCSADMYPLNTKLQPEYVLTVLLSNFFTEETLKGDTRVKMPKTNQKSLNVILVPVPPLAEQRRIVERVNELIPLVEEYGRVENAREALDAALPGRLRKSVLQLAVQGGLVPQDPADEPASTLLERIRGQRRKLVAEKKMKAPKGDESIIFAGSDGRRYEKRVDAKGRESVPACIEDEIPFEIPEGWEWARLESVTTYIQRGKSPKYSTVEKYPVIAQKCNQWSGFSVEKARFIDPATVSKYADERILKDGDLLWNSTGLGTLGRMAVYDSAKNRYGWAVADSHVTVIRTREDWLDHRFAFAYFAGPSVQSEIEDQASGSTKQKELAQETVRNYLIPVPPLAEQRRIVYEVDWLFKILV